MQSIANKFFLRLVVKVQFFARKSLVFRTVEIVRDESVHNENVLDFVKLLG